MGGAPRQQFGSCALSPLQQREGGEEGAERGRWDWTGRSTHFEARKGLSGGSRSRLARPCRGAEGIGIRPEPSWAGDTLFSGPTSVLLSLHYELLIAGTPPSETHCRGRVRTSLTQDPASETGTQSLHAAAPSGSSRFFSHLSPPFAPRSSETYGNSPSGSGRRSAAAGAAGAGTIHLRRVAPACVFQSQPRHLGSLRC